MLTWSSLRTRWASFLGSFVAVVLGVGVMTAMGLGLAATLDAPPREPQRFAGSPVVVMGRDTLTVEVRRGTDIAHITKKLAHPHPVDNELLRRLRDLGPVRTDGPARDAVGVDAPAAAVREVVREAGRSGGGARVLTGDDRLLADPATARDAEALVGVNALLGTAAGVTAFVSVFVTASTFAFVVALRRREFGLLRLAGATPGQVRRMLLGEAAALGVAASAVGCTLGAWAAPRLVRALVDGGVAPSWFALRGTTHWPYEVAFCTGVLVAVTGAWAASRRAGRTGPAEALREAAVDTGAMPWTRRTLGVGLLACGLGLLAWKLGTEPAELLKRKTYTTQPMVLITATAALAPALVRPLMRLVRLPGTSGLLIRENARTSVRRTSAVAAPVLVTVALAGSLLGSAQTVAEARATEARQQTRAQLIVTADDLMPLRTAGAPVPGGDSTGVRASGADSTGRRALGVAMSAGRRAPGVAVSANGSTDVRAPGATVSGTASTAVFVREERTALIRSDARAVTDVTAFAAVTRLPVVAGDVRALDDHSIIVNEEWERHEVGSWVRVWLGDGRPARLRIAAVLARGTGNNGAYVTAANAPGATVDRLDVRVAPGADSAAVATALRATGGQVRTTSAWLAATHPRTSPQTRLGLLVVLGIALVYTGISLAGTLLMATSARGRELRALRLAGATRAQVLRVVAGESVLAVGVGAVLGAAVTAVHLAGLGMALGRLSAPVAMAVPWQLAGGCVAACLVIAVGASVTGAWRKGRA
ncbi:ABC transporter permease [Streptomyces sp. NPDC058274]|uniref:ABC transporter permease n=1 Tax=Streptomyces sp. NPDC058274 TaxID=3346416 RepID=UPI0036E5165F